MSLKELVNLINWSKSYNFIYVDTPNSDYEYIYFRFGGIQEETELNNGTWEIGKKYNKNDVGIYIVDISIDEFVSLEIKRRYENYKYIISMISKHYSSTLILYEEIPLYFTVFCMLHEVGHQKFFNSLNLSTKDYLIKEQKDRENILTLETQLINSRDNVIKERLKAKLIEEYRNIPSEKFADSYALEHIVKVIKQING